MDSSLEKNNFNDTVEERVKEERPELEDQTREDKLAIEGQNTVKVTQARYERMMRLASPLKKLMLTHGVTPQDSLKVLIGQLRHSLEIENVPFKFDHNKVKKTRNRKYLEGVYGYLLGRFKDKERILKYGV